VNAELGQDLISGPTEGLRVVRELNQAQSHSVRVIRIQSKEERFTSCARTIAATAQLVGTKDGE
jgi:hypothetical protein